MDAEGEEDAEGEDADGEDERLYCFYQKQSYGDVSRSPYFFITLKLTLTMQIIACDNEGECPFEWVGFAFLAKRVSFPDIGTTSVPSHVCRHEAADTREVVLFSLRAQDQGQTRGGCPAQDQKGAEEATMVISLDLLRRVVMDPICQQYTLGYLMGLFILLYLSYCIAFISVRSSCKTS